MLSSGRQDKAFYVAMWQALTDGIGVFDTQVELVIVDVRGLKFDY